MTDMLLREMLRHLPPSGAELALVALGEDITAPVCALRPDVRVIWRESFADYALPLPLDSQSADALIACDALSAVRDSELFLREALRILRPGGRMVLFETVPEAEQAAQLLHLAGTLETAKFERVLTERLTDLGGVLARGERSYTHLSTQERISGTAARDSGLPGGVAQLEPIPANTLIEALTGKFVFLLAAQPTDRPPWELGRDRYWLAPVMIDRGRDGAYCLLVFSSLPKAVEFMQPAVKAGLIKGINKIAKFDKAQIATWGIDLILNPTPAILLGGDRFVFEGKALEIDPASAIVGEE